MCTTCGCGHPNSVAQGHDHDHDHSHGHDHAHDHDHGHSHDHGEGPLGAVHDPTVSRARIVQIEEDILSANNRYATANRRRLADRGVYAVNVVSSPGSGKTTLLVRTIEMLKERFPVSVIEGDQQTEFDAERIRATGAHATQVNTGKGCHLDAHMVGHALDHLDPAEGGVLFIENVGNLICPAAFDLGEAVKAVVLSVTEGEDKPLKYPDMFFEAGLMIVTKIDLLPHLTFDVERCIDYARRVNPDLQVLRLSATTGEGMEDWCDWIARRRDATLEAQKRSARAIA